MVNDTMNTPESLRERAERMASEHRIETGAMSEDQIRKVFHELEVHQAELEIQNEELKRITSELELAQTRFLRLFNRAPVGYLVLDDAGMIVRVNDTFCSMTGKTRDALKGRPFSDFIFEADRGIYRGRFRSFFKSSERKCMDIRVCTSDESFFHAQIQGGSFLDNDREAGINERRTLLLTVTDVGDRKRAEEKRIEAEQCLRQVEKAESLSRMAGAIAHNFNNILGAVIGNLELARMFPDRKEDISLHIADALEASYRAADMSGLMLSYLGQKYTKRERVDLSRVCSETLSSLRESVPGHIRVHADLPFPGPMVEADASLLRQVLINLLKNAFEAIGANEGDVLVALRTTGSDAVRAGRFFPAEWNPSDGMHVILSVTDTGEGIPPENREKLFDPFFSTRFTGRGLGLSVVLGGIRSLEGAITVESRPGRGSVFEVILPALQKEDEPEEPSGSTAPVTSGALTVLFVEDHEMVRKVGQAMIGSIGYTVLTAVNGTDAVDVFRRHQNEIDLVLMDLTMPGMDGWEAMEHIRALRQDIPVVLASGYDVAQVMGGEHAQQPQFFLQKPYTLEALSDALKKAMMNAGRKTP